MARTKQIIFNALRTPDGTVLVSRSQHDYRTYTDPTNAKKYMVDGGLAYERSSNNGDEQYMYQYYDPFDHKHNRTWMHWGTRGKDGDKPLQYKPVHQMDTDHIEAILTTQHQITDWIRGIFVEELEWRKKHP